MIKPFLSYILQVILLEQLNTQRFEMKIKHLVLKPLILAALSLLVEMLPMAASHNGNRIFFFLDRPQQTSSKKHAYLEPALFYAMSSTAFNNKGQTRSIPEFWGTYNLKDITASLTANDPTKDPFAGSPQMAYFKDKDIVFKLNDKTQAAGLALGGAYKIKSFPSWQIGAWAPVATVKSSCDFHLDRKNSDAEFKNTSLTDAQKFNQEVLVDQLRRTTHEMLKIENNEWSKTGIGDIDVFLRMGFAWDHALLMRSITFDIQGGLLLPTGLKDTVKNPFSAPLGSNDHLGFYEDIHLKLELKQDITTGFLLGFAAWQKDTETKHIPVDKESFLFSPLTGKVDVKPGALFKFSPYITLGNLTDGLNFTARYTYLRKTSEKWTNPKNLTDTSAMAQKVSAILEHGIPSVREGSRWRIHYFTFELTYDTMQALHKPIKFDPTFFVSYDMPMTGRGVAKTHQITVGAELNF